LNEVRSTLVVKDFLTVHDHRNGRKTFPNQQIIGIGWSSQSDQVELIIQRNGSLLRIRDTVLVKTRSPSSILIGNLPINKKIVSQQICTYSPEMQNFCEIIQIVLSIQIDCVEMLPIAHILEEIAPMLRWLALQLIYFYQAWLSPRKGFRCAHGVRHHGPSCSDFALEVIRDSGLTPFRSRMKQRFYECRVAAQELRLLRTMASSGTAFPDGPGIPGGDATVGIPGEIISENQKKQSNSCGGGDCDPGCFNGWDFPSIDLGSCDIFSGCGSIGDCGGADCSCG
jgi:putative component of membrane protein insertase Oxa1/YidC/SpoIIIJ protein YidD